MSFPQSATMKDLLKQAGAVLVRHRRHRVYRLANGQTLVLSNTPSDHRESRNAIADLRRAIRGQARQCSQS